jgi:hypothetical protein
MNNEIKEQSFAEELSEVNFPESEDDKILAKQYISTPAMRAEALKAAKELIRAYVGRGDTYDDISKSYLGEYTGDKDVFIGGYIWGTKISCHQIAVSILFGEVVNEVFSLRQVFDDIKSESNRLPI